MQGAWTIWQIPPAGTSIPYAGIPYAILLGDENDTSSESPKHLIGGDLVTNLAEPGSGP